MAVYKESDTEKLQYTEAGEGIPIVFIHGSLATGMETYHLQMEYFSKSFRCICPDLRCHGKSVSRKALWTTELLSEDIVRLMDSLSIDKAHLIGHSMGGEIMMYVVLNHNDRVLSATSVSSGGAINKSITNYLHRFDPDHLDPVTYSDFFNRIKREHGEANYGDWKGFIKRTIWNCDNFPGFSDDDLSRMHHPFLLIRGKKDRLVKDQEVERLQTYIPDFHVIEMDGGHYLTSDEKTAQIINHHIYQFITNI